MLTVTAVTMTATTVTGTVVAIGIAWETAMETDTVTGIVSATDMVAVAVMIMGASDTAKMSPARMTLAPGEGTKH